MERAKKIWPWISLAWGIFSGVSMSRDFSQSLKIAIFALAVILVSMVLALVRELAVLRGLTTRGLKGTKSLEWVSNTSLQVWSQTVMMFSLPMLFLGDAWLAFAVTGVLAVLSLWDPWYERFIAHSAGRALFRTWAGLLTVSFLSGVVFPAHVGQFYRFFWVIPLVLSFPWLGIAKRSWSTSSFLPFGLSFCLALGSIFQMTKVRFPLICIWLEKPGFFERGAPEAAKFVRALSEEDVDFKEGLCFMSPVIAARDVKTSLIHEWYVNEVLVDRIPLKDVMGRENKLSFHTWSCKQNFPPNLDSIRVKVLLPDGAILGERSLSKS